MRKYMLLTPETLNKIAWCFSSQEEFQEFVGQMGGLLEELAFMIQLESRVGKDHVSLVLLKQVCVFALFCREHMDLLHQLISKMDAREITEEEAKGMGL